MRRQALGLHLCSAILALGCGEDISLGDPQCAGEGVICETREPAPIELKAASVEPAEQPVREATVVWRETFGPDLCREQSCRVGRAGDMVVHRDRSVTIAQSLSIQESDSQSSFASYLWLARIAADGTRVWETLTTAALTVQLVLDDDDRAALVTTARSNASSVNSNASSVNPLILYALDADSGAVNELFEFTGRDAWPDILGAGIAGNDVVLLRGHGSPFLPWLEGYTRGGELRFRQVRLEGRLRATSQVPDSVRSENLVVDSEGRPWTVVQPETTPLQFTRLTISGNVSWNGWLSSPWPALDLSAVRMVLDAQDRPVVAFSLADEYFVARFEAGEDSMAAVGHYAQGRARTAYYAPTVLGLNVDASGRVTIATQDGVRDRGRLVIERFSADLTQRTTFSVISEGAPQRIPDRLVVGPDQDVYLIEAEPGAAVGTDSAEPEPNQVQPIKISRLHLD